MATYNLADAQSRFDELVDCAVAGEQVKIVLPDGSVAYLEAAMELGLHTPMTPRADEAPAFDL